MGYSPMLLQLVTTSDPYACYSLSFVLCVCFVDRCLSFFFWPLCCLFLVNRRMSYNTMAKKGQRTNNDVKKRTEMKYKKTKMEQHQKPGSELIWSKKPSRSYSTCNTHRFTIKPHEHDMMWKSCWHLHGT